MASESGRPGRAQRSSSCGSAVLATEAGGSGRSPGSSLFRAGVRSRRIAPLASLALAGLGLLSGPDLAQAQASAASGAVEVVLLDPAEDLEDASINTKLDEREPALGPDGRLLLFASNRSGAYRLHAVYIGRWPAPGELLAPADTAVGPRPLPAEALQPVPAAGGKRGLPEVPWLGGPGDQRSPCLCETAPFVEGRAAYRLFYRSEAEWGAGLYAAELQVAVVPAGAQAGGGRLLLSTERVRPVWQELGLAFEGPWWVPEGAWAGPGALLLARGGGAWRAWRSVGCQLEPLAEAELHSALPWLRQQGAAEGLFWARSGPALVSAPGARGRLDFQWIGAPGPPLGASLAGATVNTEVWDELEAAFGPEQAGRRLLVFTRENSSAARDGNLLMTWLPVP